MEGQTPEQLQEELKKTQEALKAKEDEAKKLEENIKSYQTKDTSLESIQTKLMDQQKELEAQRQENIKMKMDLAKNEAIKKFPYAASFAPHLTGATHEEIEAKAKEFHESVSKQREEAVKAKETELASAWGQIPSGSPPGMLKQEDLDAQYEKAKQNKDIKGMLANKFIRLGQKMNEATAR